LNTFQIAEPVSIEEAVQLLDNGEEIVRPISGGTALVLLLKSGLFQPDRLISLRRVNGLTGIEQANGELRVGAMTTLSRLGQLAEVQELFPVIGRTLVKLSNVQVRNIATLGGHLAHGDPHMDLPPVLLTLNARIEVAGLNGTRWMPLDKLFEGYYETSLSADEIITRVAIPVPSADSAATYEKFTALSADDWPTVGIAVSATHSNRHLAGVRLAVGAVTDRPLLISKVEDALINQPLTDALIDDAADLVASEVEPLGDVRGSSEYKREMVRVHTRRALLSVRSSFTRGDTQ